MPVNSQLFLIGAALLPALILCVYIYSKDRVEKEPIGLLIKLFFAGVICCVPSALAEGFLIDVLDAVFLGMARVNANGVPVINKGMYSLYRFLQCFVGIALVEEGFKFLALIYITKNNKEFNSLFDGIVYAVFVSLGFAAFENIFYVLENGIMNAIMRGILSVPGHMFFAVMMGYYYSQWHIIEKVILAERSLKSRGIIAAGTPEFTTGRTIFMCVFVPVLAHGAYDYCCMYGSTMAIIGLYVLVGFMYIHCFKTVKKFSRADAGDDRYAYAILMRKYPQLANNTDREYTRTR